MIGSLIEQMKNLRRFKIKPDEDFVLEIKKGKTIIAELKVNVQEINYNLATKESEVKIAVLNPYAMHGKTTITEFYND